jgi:uncharacterized membrane protein YbhN (UPF0104 family)
VDLGYRRGLADGVFRIPLVTPAQAEQPAPRLSVKKLLLVLGLVATAYAVALAFFGEASPAVALQGVFSLTGLAAAALCLLNYLLRGLRWRGWMAHYQRPLGVLQGLRLYVSGYALTPTPGNVGEAVRGLWLVRQPLSTAQSLAIFGAERLADLLCLLLMALPALGWLALLKWHSDLGLMAWGLGFWGWSAGLLAVAVLGVLGVLGFMAVVVVRRSLARPQWAERLAWLHEAWHCLAHQPWRWLALTLAAWAAQGAAVALLCRAAGLDISAWLAAGFYALAMVGGALSALPAGLGGTEALLVLLLVGQGAAVGTAVALTVLVRLLTLWLAVALGLLALLYSVAIRKDIRF